MRHPALQADCRQFESGTAHGSSKPNAPDEVGVHRADGATRAQSRVFLGRVA